jgi:hypothetical protein
VRQQPDPEEASVAASLAASAQLSGGGATQGAEDEDAAAAAKARADEATQQALADVVAGMLPDASLVSATWAGDDPMASQVGQPYSATSRSVF